MKMSLAKNSAFLILFFVLIAVVTHQCNAMKLYGGVIAGRLLRTDGETPVAGAAIFVRQTSPDKENPVKNLIRSASNGTYAVDRLEPGLYSVNVTHEDYIPADKEEIAVAKDKVTKDVDFFLIKGAIITGKVTASDGITPIPGAMVSAAGSDKMPEQANETDEDGTYILKRLPPDKYWIQARKDGYAMEVTFPLAVEEGEEICTIDFTLHKAFKLQGKILISDSQVPAEKAVIFAGSEKRVYGRAAADENGNYEIEGLPKNVNMKLIISAKNCDVKKINELFSEDGSVIERTYYLRQPIEDE